MILPATQSGVVPTTVFAESTQFATIFASVLIVWYGTTPLLLFGVVWLAVW